MTRQTEWAIFTTGALCRDIEFARHRIVVTRCAIVPITTGADEKCDGAAVHALPINEFVTMQLTDGFAVAKLFSHA